MTDLNPKQGMDAAPSQFDMPYQTNAHGSPAHPDPNFKAAHPGRTWQNPPGSAAKQTAAYYNAFLAGIAANEAAGRAADAAKLAAATAAIKRSPGSAATRGRKGK